MPRRQPHPALERPNPAHLALEAMGALDVMEEVGVVDGMVVVAPCTMDTHQEVEVAIQRARTLST